MNHKHQNRFNPSLALRRVSRPVMLCLTLPGLLAAIPVDEETATTAAPAETAAETVSAADLPAAQDVLTKLRDRLENLGSLQCDLHQTAVISAIKVVSAGRYAEASGNRVRLQMMMFPMNTFGAADGDALNVENDPQIPDAETARGSLLQVSDGSVVYTEWRNGEEPASVTRRTLADVVTAAEKVENYAASAVLADMGVGGLRSLIARLQDTMAFAPVSELIVNDRKVLQITGRWNDRVRREIFQLPEDVFVDARPWVPEYVRIYVDAESSLPRRIQFLKHSLDATQKLARPLLTLDLRNIRVNEQVADDLFSYRAPEGAREEDVTEALIRSIEAASQRPAPQNPPQ